jgi:ferritin-like metal-binding protein YciE
MVNANPEKKISKLSFFGIKILEFLNNKCHLANSTNQPVVTSGMITSKNSILKFEILSYTILISDAMKNAA